MRTLVVGLGNPILGDDGVGWKIAEKIQEALNNPQSSIGNAQSVEVDCFSLGGLSLMERLIGYTRVILVDAIHTGQKPVGSIGVLPLGNLPDYSAGHTTAAHDTSLRTALNVGRSMGVSLPNDDNVIVVAIEAENVYDFSEKLSPSVESAVPVAVEKVIELLKKYRWLSSAAGSVAGF